MKIETVNGYKCSDGEVFGATHADRCPIHESEQ